MARKPRPPPPEPVVAPVPLRQVPRVPVKSPPAKSRARLWIALGIVAVVAAVVWLAFFTPDPDVSRPCSKMQSFILQGTPAGGAAMLERARRMADRGDLAAAVASLQSVVESYPRFAAAHYILAIYLMRSAALHVLACIESSHPNLVSMVSTHSFCSQGDVKGSVKHNRLSIKANPESPDAYVNLGSLG